MNQIFFDPRRYDLLEVKERVMNDSEYEEKLSELFETFDTMRKLAITRGKILSENIEAVSRMNKADEEIQRKIYQLVGEMAKIYTELYNKKMEEYRREVERDAHLRKQYYHKHMDKERKFKTISGIYVRSKNEKIIADFYTREGIEFVYEPMMLNGKKEPLFPDFYLPQFSTYHEHHGGRSGEDSDDYEFRVGKKMEDYEGMHSLFIHTFPQDEGDLEGAIIRKLEEKGIIIGRT